jgi:glucosamine--fructose-6-phosphate aminotransferase (isomerizing)
MLSEMLEQPKIINSILNNPNIETLAKIIVEKDIQQIILTGSGDSYCAAWFGDYLGEAWCPTIDVKHYAPFEFVNYSQKLNFEKTAVIGISVSGGTLRVLESIRFASKHGATTIAITDNPQGKLIKDSDYKLLINASPPESLQTTSYTKKGAKEYTGYHNDVAQTKTFLANLAVLSLFMAHLSKKPTDNLKNIQESFSLVDRAIKQRNSLIDVGRDFSTASNNVFFVASGSSSPIGLFGAYKMFEFTIDGFACDIEEYCHTRYFITTDQSSVIFLAHDPSSFDRIMEIEPVLREKIGAKTVILTNAAFQAEIGPSSIPILSPQDSVLSPLVFTVPIEFFSYSLAKHKGFDTNVFRGGQETEKYVAGSYKTIRQSKLRF